MFTLRRWNPLSCKIVAYLGERKGVRGMEVSIVIRFSCLIKSYKIFKYILLTYLLHGKNSDKKSCNWNTLNS